MFPSKSCIGLPLIFRSLIHFELSFAYDLRQRSSFILLHVNIQSSPEAPLYIYKTSSSISWKPGASGNTTWELPTYMIRSKFLSLVKASHHLPSTGLLLFLRLALGISASTAQCCSNTSPNTNTITFTCNTCLFLPKFTHPLRNNNT